MLLALAALAGTALGYESDTQPVEIGDTAVLFTGSNVDTDWLPDGSPITVRFQILSEGGAAVDMSGSSYLSWPDGLNLGFEGEAGSGVLLVDAALAAVTSVRFDLFGYSWESEIDRRSVGVTGETTFDPFVLDGAATERVEVATTGASTEVVNYELEVFTGVSVDFTATLTPTGSTGFEGVSWWIGDSQISTEGGTTTLSAEPSASVLVEPIFVGAWDSALDLTITPAVSVCFPIYGCEEVASFDIPLSLASDAFEQAFPATSLEFPLPMLESGVSAYDFGEVMVGDLANLELPIANGGLLDLQGEIGVTGSTYFSLFPGEFYAAPDMVDGVVVTFAPESEGLFEGTVLLTSNDPWEPLVEIAITGTGVLPEEELDTGLPAEDDGKQVKTCGCASGGHGVSGAISLTVLAVLAARRRRPQVERIG